MVLANIVRASVAGYVFAIAGYGLRLDAQLPFEWPARRDSIFCWSPPAGSQPWVDLGRF